MKTGIEDFSLCFKAALIFLFEKQLYFDGHNSVLYS